MTVTNPWDDDRDDWDDWDESIDLPDLEVDMTDNPITAELLDADGHPIRQWRERPPIGFHPNTNGTP